MAGKVLVVGATGSVGGDAARRLLQAGRDVRVLLRPHAAQTAWKVLGAEVAIGDLKDPASLAAACAGCDVVVTSANSAQRGGEDTTESVDLNGNAALVDAAKAAGVGHFVFVSALGATTDSPSPFMAAKARTEERLKASGMRWTILAPTMFSEIWPPMVVGMPASRGMPVTLVGQAKRKHAFVHGGDVAAFAAAAAGDPKAFDRHLPIGGPQAYTWRDVVGVYEKVLGRALEVRFVPVGEPVPLLPPMMSELVSQTEFFDSSIDTTALAHEFGVRLTSVEEVARRIFAA